jgi:hypothetical protein
VKIVEGYEVGARSLAYITLGVKGHVGVLGWDEDNDKWVNYSHGLA